MLYLLWCVQVPLVLRSPALEPALHMCLTRAEQGGRITITSLNLLDKTLIQ